VLMDFTRVERNVNRAQHGPIAPRSSSSTTWNKFFTDINSDHGDGAVEVL
jgi:hypothetical protein